VDFLPEGGEDAAVTEKNPLQLQFSFALEPREMVATLINRKFNIMLAAEGAGKRARNDDGSKTQK
jgi:hypothetical protein